MSNATTVASISVGNPPRQLDLLASVARILENSPAVSHLLVRGSFATGRADRSSDVDLVIGVLATALQPFLSSLDALVRTELGALLPGWPDSLVRDMGGQGYVYLVPAQETLCELDLYVVPEHRVPSILERGAAAIFSRVQTCQSDRGTHSPDPPNIPRPNSPKASIAHDVVVEILVLLHMMTKRVTRRQSFIVYGQTYLLNDAVRRLIKHCLAPGSEHWGWYHLAEDLAGDPRGSTCLCELAALVSAPPVRDHKGLQDVFTHVERVIACAAPEVWSELGRELEAYRHYTGLR